MYVVIRLTAGSDDVHTTAKRGSARNVNVVTRFTARCYASAVLAMGLCLCLSVRPSVRHKSVFYLNG